jgi:hypothetical protein
MTRLHSFTSLFTRSLERLPEKTMFRWASKNFIPWMLQRGFPSARNPGLNSALSKFSIDQSKPMLRNSTEARQIDSGKTIWVGSCSTSGATLQPVVGTTSVPFQPMVGPKPPLCRSCLGSKIPASTRMLGDSKSAMQTKRLYVDALNMR